MSLNPWEERKSPELSADALAKKLTGQLVMTIPEAQAFAFGPSPIPATRNWRRFQFHASGSLRGDVKLLSDNLDKLMAAARKRPELTKLNSPFRPFVPQLYVDVDQDKVLKQGIPIASVYQSLQAFLGGAYVNQFNRFGRQWKVFLQAEPQYRVNPQ